MMDRVSLPPLSDLHSFEVSAAWVTRSTAPETARPIESAQPEAAIVEAQGWVIAANSEIQLVAATNPVQPDRSVAIAAPCPAA